MNSSAEGEGQPEWRHSTHLAATTPACVWLGWTRSFPDNLFSLEERGYFLPHIKKKKNAKGISLCSATGSYNHVLNSVDQFPLDDAVVPPGKRGYCCYKEGNTSLVLTTNLAEALFLLVHSRPNPTLHLILRAF